MKHPLPSLKGNNDEPVTLRLEHLAPLSNLQVGGRLQLGSPQTALLPYPNTHQHKQTHTHTHHQTHHQVLHVGKRTAYFPDRRRMGEASVRIPIDAAATEALAAACGGLRSLRLALGSGDVTAEGLQRLSMFTQLERCGGGWAATLFRFLTPQPNTFPPSQPPQPTHQTPPPSQPTPPPPSLSVHAEPFSGPAPAAPLSLAHIPSGLTRLELRHVDVVDDPQGEAVLA